MTTKIIAFLKLIFIGEEVLCNVLLVPANKVWFTCNCISSFSFGFISYLGPYRVLSLVPGAI